jgi:trans-aconitate 2-methyltransferase
LARIARIQVRAYCVISSLQATAGRIAYTGDMAWDPALYEQFMGSRLRPGIDLIANIPDVAADRVIDLGCGTGRLTERLRARWPRAEVVGLDSSPAMLEQAREDFPAIEWTEGDVADWAPEEKIDIIMSNAALHWLPDHAALFPRLFGYLAPGGVLAVQMPRNWTEPSHMLVRQVAGELGFGERMGPEWIPVSEPAFYYDLMAPIAANLEIWETTYIQPLEGDNPVVDWIRSTALQPVMDKLEKAEAEEFLRVYGERVREAYQKRQNGITLFPFRRLFIMAMAAA